MRSTARICATVPGLKATWLMPASVSSSISATASSSSGMPAVTIDAVERRAGGAGPLHQALAAELQLPQVRVEEQRVELHRAARVAAGSSARRRGRRRSAR